MSITKEQLKETGKKIFTWRSIYNKLCPKCKNLLYNKVIAANVKTMRMRGKDKIEYTTKATKEAMAQFCEQCRKLVNYD